MLKVILWMIQSPHVLLKSKPVLLKIFYPQLELKPSNIKRRSFIAHTPWQKQVEVKWNFHIMYSVLRKLPLKYFIFVIQFNYDSLAYVNLIVQSCGCVSAFLVCVSGGGGPETSERSDWTSAPCRTDPAQAMNNGHYNRKQLFFCFILIMTTFYLDSKNHCFVYSQSWCQLCLWETYKWDFWNKSIHPTLRQSPVSLISYFENAKHVFIVLTAEKWPWVSV